jgi:heat shock protein HslJ
MRTCIVAVLAFVSLAACSSPQVSVGRPPAPLTGTDWKLYELHDLPVIGSGPNQTAATLRIDGGALTGFTGCNRVSGPVSSDGDKVHFGPLATTRMACLDTNLGRQESGLIKALNAAKRQRIIGDTLTLLDDAGSLARFIVTTPR